jgi:hypothetical protein
VDPLADGFGDPTPGPQNDVQPHSHRRTRHASRCHRQVRPLPRCSPLPAPRRSVSGHRADHPPIDRRDRGARSCSARCRIFPKGKAFPENRKTGKPEGGARASVLPSRRIRALQWLQHRRHWRAGSWQRRDRRACEADRPGPGKRRTKQDWHRRAPALFTMASTAPLHAPPSSSSGTPSVPPSRLSTLSPRATCRCRVCSVVSSSPVVAGRQIVFRFECWGSRAAGDQCSAKQEKRQDCNTPHDSPPDASGFDVVHRNVGIEVLSGNATGEQ